MLQAPSGVLGTVMAENEFDAVWSCQKASGGNQLEYYEKVHVLQ